MVHVAESVAGSSYRTTTRPHPTVPTMTKIFDNFCLTSRIPALEHRSRFHSIRKIYIEGLINPLPKTKGSNSDFLPTRRQTRRAQRRYASILQMHLTSPLGLLFQSVHGATTVKILGAQRSYINSIPLLSPEATWSSAPRHFGMALPCHGVSQP